VEVNPLEVLAWIGVGFAGTLAVGLAVLFVIAAALAWRKR
jgi:hypothetical protein